MQKLKLCRKLMAFVLTLCMVLPLISNQYLVVRAAETGDTAVTKKLSDLVQEHKYVTVDMTQGKDVALNDQQWTESAYTYVTSNREASEKQTETVQGALYQLKVKKGQTIGVETEIHNWLYWYTPDHMDDWYLQDGMRTYTCNQEEETIYLWIPKGDVNGNPVPETFAVSFIQGRKPEAYKEKAVALSLDTTITLDTSASNYIQYLGMSGSSLVSGWLYKSSLAEGYYTVAGSDKLSEALGLNVYALTDDCTYELGLPCTAVVSDYNQNTEKYELSADAYFRKQGYVLISAYQGASQLPLSLSLIKAKTLSELSLPVLEEDTARTISSDDPAYMGADGYEKLHMYGLTLKAGEKVFVTMAGKQFSVMGSFYAMDENRLCIGTSCSANSSQSLLLTNDTAGEKTYYIGVPQSLASSAPEAYTIQYKKACTLADYADSAVSLSEKVLSKKITKNDTVPAVVKTRTGDDAMQSGVLVKLDIPANSVYTFKLDNDSSYKSYQVYTDLSDALTSETVETASKILENLTDKPKTYYVWITEDMFMQTTTDTTVSLTKENYCSYTDVSELKPGDNPISGEAQTVMAADGDGNPLSMKGYVYKYTVPAEGKYAIGMKRTSSDSNENQYMCIYTESEGRLTPYMAQVGISADRKQGVCTNYLENEKTYYIYVKNMKDNSEITDGTGLDTVSIFIRNDVPCIDAYKGTAQVLNPGQTTTVAYDDKNVVDTYGGFDVAKLYKLTLQDEEQVDVSSTGHFMVRDEQNISASYGDSSDFEYKGNSAAEGTLRNSSGAAKTYYIVAGSYVQSITVGEVTKQAAAVAIESANIPELSLDQTVAPGTLSRQRVSYTGRDTENKVGTIKKDAFWVKVSVPKGKVCTIKPVIPDVAYASEYRSAWELMAEAENEDVYREIFLDNLNDCDAENTTGTFTEGTYYVMITGSEEKLPIGLKLAEIPKVATLKDSSVEIPGTGEAVTVAKRSGVYVLRRSGGNCERSEGDLVKVKVPAKETCTLTFSGDISSMYLLDDELEQVTQIGTENLTIQNTLDTEKTYYVWTVFGAGKTGKVSARKVTLLNDRFESAEKLEKGKSASYKYDKTDAAYMDEAAYSVYDRSYTQKNAKLYMVEGNGTDQYTLTIASQQEAKDVKIVVFTNNRKQERELSLDANNQAELNLYLMNGEKKYILIAENTDTPSASLQITLSDITEERNLWNHTNEATELKTGVNTVPDQTPKKDYVYKLSYFEEDNPDELINTYEQANGRLYKYEMQPFTKLTIQAEHINSRVSVFEDPAEARTTFMDVWIDTPSILLENNTGNAKTIYMLVRTSEIGEEWVGSITLTTSDILANIAEKAENAPELNTKIETVIKKETLYKVSRGVKQGDTIKYKPAVGQLFKLDVPEKHSVKITATKNAGIAVYNGTDETPDVDEKSTATFTSLATDMKTYYVWIETEEDGVKVNVTLTSLDPEDKGDKIETVIPVSDAKVTISETKDTTASEAKVSEAAITVSASADGSISTDAIKESIKIANQYNTDNEDVAGQAKVTSIQTTYTDDSADAIIAADVVEALKEMDTKVDLEVSKVTAANKVEYTWKMKADSIAHADSAAINTKVAVNAEATNAEDEKKINELAKTAETEVTEVKKQVVEFKHNGKLPAKTEVTVAVDQALNGKTVYYFHFDKTAGAEKLDYTGKANVENGYVTMVLDHCSDYVIFDKNVCTHSETKEEGGKEATCGTAGYTGDVYCKTCNELVKKGEVIPKTGKHTAGEWEGEKAATTTEEGSRIKKCTVCGEVVDREAIAKLPSPTPTPDPEPTPAPVVTPNVTVSYRTHVQSIGWQNPVTNGTMSGTSGRAKRLEGIEISVAGNSNLGIQYTTHCQSYGWLPWSANGEMNGTEGEAKRLEAIKIQLTGADKDKYNVYYRVHAQSYGWLAWAANGAPAGTAGLAKRLEAIQIVIVKKGESFDHAIGNIQSARGEAYIASSTANANPVVAGENNVNVEYRTHVQSFGWQGWKYNGVMSGTSGKAKRLEGINIKLTNKPYSGSIVYTTHVQSIGWQGNENNVNTWFRDGQMAGTSGRAKRLEAIRIALTGEMAEHYDVYYRVHAQSFGWLDWTKNGEAAGTAGLAKRLEGIQIVLVPKGGAAPARNYGGVVTINNNSYIKR